MIGIAAAGVVVSIFTYEKRPPAMFTGSQTKEVVGMDEQSEAELGLVVHSC